MKESFKLKIYEKEKILNLYSGGMAIGRVCKMFNVTRPSIYLIKRKGYDWIKEQIFRRDRCTCQICKNPGTKISNLGSNLPHKGSRVLCGRCLSNIQKLVRLGYLDAPDSN